MSTTRRRLNLFVSFAHADEVEEKQLLVHLKALDRGGYYTIWEDRQIEAGQEWDREIKQHLAQADVVLRHTGRIQIFWFFCIKFCGFDVGTWH